MKQTNEKANSIRFSIAVLCALVAVCGGISRFHTEEIEKLRGRLLDLLIQRQKTYRWQFK